MVKKKIWPKKIEKKKENHINNIKRKRALRFKRPKQWYKVSGKK